MDDRCSKSRAQRGLTLVEILVALAVLGVVLGVAVPSLSDLIERRRLVAAAGEVANVIQYARSEPSLIGQKVTLHFDRMAGVNLISCVAVVTQSGTDECKCYETEKPVCPVTGFSGSKLLRLYQLRNASGVSFEYSATSRGSNQSNTLTLLRGQVVTDATEPRVTFTGTRTKAQLVIEMNNLGRVRTCSPKGSISGYPVCS